MYYNKNSVYTHKIVFSQGKKQAFTHIAHFARSSTIIHQQLSIYNKISLCCNTGSIKDFPNLKRNKADSYF